MSNAETNPPPAAAPANNNANAVNAPPNASSANPVDANNANQTAPQHPPYATSASLYVGELSPEVTEAMLFELFNQIGPVASIRVCRDAVTRGSLGYAYTNFHNMGDAERAMETFNYQPIKGKPCRIMWSQRDPSVRKTGSGNIFIKNLDRTIDNKVLHDTFSAFGNILSCKVATDDAGESRGYGFVHYETSEAAQNAIKHVDGMLLNDRKVFVGQHVPKRERDANSGEVKAKFTNVFVKNLADEVTEEELRELFAPYGVITSLAIASNDDESKPKGFGFLNFEDYASAEKAVEELNEKELHGKTIFVGRAQKKGEREEELRRHFEQLKLEKMNKFAGINLYVKNLDDTIDDERLRTEFAVYGDITSAKVMKDERGVSKGFGFVCFGIADEANKAVTEMNNKMLGSKPIYVALAQRKDQRKQQLEAQYAQRGASRHMQQPMIPAMPYGPMYYQQGPGGMHLQGGMPPRQSGFMYPPQMQNFRPRFSGPGQGAQGQQRGAAPMGFQIPGAPYMPGMPQMAQGDQRNQQRGGRGGNNNSSRTTDVPGSMPSQMASQQMPPNSRGPLPPRGPGYKYNSVRNVTTGGASNISVDGEQSLTSLLTSLPPAAQKQLLGERLYPAIQNQLGSAKKHLAGKVTGMLLEMDNTELLHLLEDGEALNEKVGEAWEVLERHRKKDEGEKLEL